MNILFFLLEAGPSPPLIPFVVIGTGILCYLMYLAAKLLDKYDNNPEALKAIECLKFQARKRDGGVVKDGVSRLTPELTFRHDDGTFTVSMHKGGKGVPSVTYVTFETKLFPDKNFRIASKKFKAVVSFSRIKDFYSDLCLKYELEGNSSAFIGNLLTREIQNDLMQYQQGLELRFGFHRSVIYTLKPAPGRFYLLSDNFRVENKDYDRLIETTIKIYEQLKIMTWQQVK